MPGMNGIDLARELRTQFPDMPMALVTANIQDYVVAEAKSLGVSFISKPFELNTVVAFLDAVGR